MKHVLLLKRRRNAFTDGDDFDGFGTIETIVRLLRPYKVFQRANLTISHRRRIVGLALFLYVKQHVTNIDLWTTLLLARFLHVN